MNRRFFLKSGSIALASVGMSLSAPGFLERVVLGNELTGEKRKTLIAIFQRGAVDGLNMVVPFGESNYYSLRPSIAIPKPESGNADAAINRSNRSGIRSDWRSFMLPARRTILVHTSMRRTTWSRRLPV